MEALKRRAPFLAGGALCHCGVKFELVLIRVRRSPWTRNWAEVLFSRVGGEEAHAHEAGGLSKQLPDLANKTKENPVKFEFQIVFLI